MANYHVTKDKDTGDWKTKREGADRAAGHYDTQAEAEKAAKEFSRACCRIALLVKRQAN